MRITDRVNRTSPLTTEQEVSNVDSFTAQFHPDGSCTVTLDNEVRHYTAEEVAEMEQDYEQALARTASRSSKTPSR